jgi:hypothetical protein
MAGKINLSAWTLRDFIKTSGFGAKRFAVYQAGNTLTAFVFSTASV